MYQPSPWQGGADPSDLASYAIATRPEDLAIGMIGLRSTLLPHCAAELSTWLGKQYWNQGYGTDAVRTLVDYGFRALRLHKVFLRVLVLNTRAIRCYEKCGFQCEGVHREELYLDGAWHDLMYMGIVAPTHEHAAAAPRGGTRQTERKGRPAR
jgi:RimJ/RimL family protein N-acetyltransferase